MLRTRRFGGLLLVGLASSGLAQQRPEQAEAASLVGVALERLCVTNGAVAKLPSGELAIDTPSSRGFVRGPTGEGAEVRFRYLGPSMESKPLASGEMRRQIGLKLRAQDTCNLLYAMWHFEPDSRIAVSVKRNPGKRTHEQCGAQGYVNIKPRTSVAVPRVLPGETHRFRADLRGTELSVFADGRLVWEGSVGNQVLKFDGPVGFRTDNARFAFRYFTSPLGPGERPHGTADVAQGCRQSAGD